MNPSCTHAGPTLRWKEGVSVFLWLADLDSDSCIDAAHRLVDADDGFRSADGLRSRSACACMYCVMHAFRHMLAKEGH